LIFTQWLVGLLLSNKAILPLKTVKYENKELQTNKSLPFKKEINHMHFSNYDKSCNNEKKNSQWNDQQ